MALAQCALHFLRWSFSADGWVAGGCDGLPPRTPSFCPPVPPFGYSKRIFKKLQSKGNITPENMGMQSSATKERRKRERIGRWSEGIMENGAVREASGGRTEW